MTDMDLAPRSPTAETFALDMRQAAGAFAQLAEHAKRSMTAFGEAFRQALEPTRRAAHLRQSRRYPKGHIRCRECHPCANPRPLKVNGDDYQRRRRNRRRRIR